MLNFKCEYCDTCIFVFFLPPSGQKWMAAALNMFKIFTEFYECREYPERVKQEKNISLEQSLLCGVALLNKLPKLQF